MPVLFTAPRMRGARRRTADFLQFSDSRRSSPSQIAALIGQNGRAADIGSSSDVASLADAMAAFSKHSRIVASIGVAGPGATQSSDSEAGRAPSSAAAEDLRRSADGFLDIEFYKARAHAIRRATLARLACALKRMIRAALARAYSVILAKRGRE